MYSISYGVIKFKKTIYKIIEEELLRNNISRSEYLEMRERNGGSIIMDDNMDIYIKLSRLDGNSICCKVLKEHWKPKLIQ